MLWKQLTPQYRRLLKNGQRGQAIVVNAKADRSAGTSGAMGRDGLAGIGGPGGIYGWNVTIRVTLPGGGTADVDRYVEAASTRDITPGMTLPIRFDPAEPARVEIDVPALTGVTGSTSASHATRAGGTGGSTRPDGGKATEGHGGNQPDPRVRRARVALREARRRGDPAKVEQLTAELDELEHGSTHARAQSRSGPGAEPIEQRLAKRPQLREDGILTPEEYTAQRQHIVDSP